MFRAVDLVAAPGVTIDLAPAYQMAAILWGFGAIFVC